jgi:hypothetical protein
MFAGGTPRQTTGVPTLDGVWRVEREAGILPPFGVMKRIFGDSGWTLVGGVPAGHFRVKGNTLEYVGWPVKDVLTPRDDGSWSGRGLMLGREFCRFRMIREAT